MDRYFTSRHTRQLADARGSAKIEVPPPPVSSESQISDKAKEGTRHSGLVRPDNKCPLCNKEIDQASLSYIQTVPKAFDYQCLAESIKKSSKCPLTGYPLTLGDIRRVYLA